MDHIFHTNIKHNNIDNNKYVSMSSKSAYRNDLKVLFHNVYLI